MLSKVTFPRNVLYCLCICVFVYLLCVVLINGCVTCKAE
jgi:hypothetical protein